jgi:thiamine biosynthesis lipoprotein
MGSTYEVKFVADVAVAAVRAVVERELSAFDLVFSQWRDDSEIARCNRHASTAPFPVTPRFAEVLQLALRIAAATDGAFDPTVKPLSDLYRTARQDPAHHLDAAAMAAARPPLDFRQVDVHDGAVHKRRPDVQLDLDGIVAGAAADAIAVRMHDLGVHSFFLEITGEVLAHGEKAPGVPWVAGVVDPSSDAQGGQLPVRSLPLRDRALCTSGDYRNGFLADGAFVHHVFDPRTGKNAPHRVVSVSVLAASAAVADALGTAFLVLGDEATAPLLPRLQVFGELGVLFLVGTDDGDLRQVEFAWPR